MPGWTPVETDYERRHTLRDLQRTAPLWRANGHSPSEYPGQRALTPGGIAVQPGQRVEVYRVRFEYKGPARKLQAVWALKPRTGLLGTDFNDGANIIFTGRGFSPYLFVPATPNWTTYDSQVNLSLAFPFGFPMLAPGIYGLEGGGEGTINAGGVDTWAWIVDTDAIELLGLPQSPDVLSQERFILALDTDAGVWNLGAAPAVSEVRGLGLAYRVG